MRKIVLVAVMACRLRKHSLKYCVDVSEGGRGEGRGKGGEGTGERGRGAGRGEGGRGRRGEGVFLYMCIYICTHHSLCPPDL